MRWLEGNWKAGVLCGVIALALIFIALFKPWFGVDATYHTLDDERIGGLDLDFALREFTYHWDWQEVTREDQTITYSDLSQDKDWRFANVLGMTQVLAISPLIFILLLLIFGLLAARGRIDNRIGVTAGILALVLTIAGPAYFMTAFPSAIEEEATQLGSPPISGFWGSDSDEYLGYPGRVTWGPGWAWFLMVGASLFVLMGTIMFAGFGSSASRKRAPARACTSEDEQN